MCLLYKLIPIAINTKHLNRHLVTLSFGKRNCSDGNILLTTTLQKTKHMTTYYKNT